MAGTQVSVQRQTVVVSGTNKYTITAACIAAGTLQDTGIFLLTIVTDTDPKDDTFLRVIEIADITTYGTDRDEAVRDEVGAWRSSSVTLSYDDIQTANAAWKEFSSRINLLVENHDMYLDEFQTFTVGEVVVYPAVDESAKTAFKDAYAATVPLVTAAQEALTAHQLECTQEESELTSIEVQLQQAQADLVPCIAIQATIAAASATYTTVYATTFSNNGQVRALNSASAATEPEQDAIEVLLVSNDAMLAQFATTNASLAAALSGNITSVVNSLQARIVSLTQQKNTLVIQLNKCHTTASKLQAAVTTAIANREAALAAVVAVCPDFVP